MMQMLVAWLEFWSQADLVARAVAVILMSMSISSWTVILGKLVVQTRFASARRAAMAALRDSESPQMACRAIVRADKSGLIGPLANGVADALAHLDAAGCNTDGGVLHQRIDAAELLARAVAVEALASQARFERGLTLLGSVGSTAPFVGLFGTVWGIHHALTGLAGATHVVLDKVAGPVGEALVMTAAGLAVAIPAVLAYNAFGRSNRLALAQLESLSHRLQAWLLGGVRVGG